MRKTTGLLSKWAIPFALVLGVAACDGTDIMSSSGSEPAGPTPPSASTDGRLDQIRRLYGEELEGYNTFLLEDVGNVGLRVYAYREGGGYRVIDVPDLDRLAQTAAAGPLCSVDSFSPESMTSNVLARYYQGSTYSTQLREVSASGIIDKIRVGTLVHYESFQETQNVRSVQFFEKQLTDVRRANWNVDFEKWRIARAGENPNDYLSAQVSFSSGRSMETAEFHATLSVNGVPSLPPAPTLTQPANNAVWAGGDVIFRWTSNDSDVYSILQIDTDNCFDNPTEYTTIAQEYTVALPRNYVYYWRVISVDTRNSTVRRSSATYSFDIAPLPPNLSGTIVNNNPSLSWSSPAGAVGYRLKRVVLPNGLAEYIDMGTATSFLDTSQYVTGMGASVNSVVYQVQARNSRGSYSSISNSVSYRRPL